MEKYFSVGTGLKKGSVGQLDFAKDALSLVSQIAVDIGAEQKLCTAGCLAAKLYIARKNLEAADLAESPEVPRRVPKLLKDLERICTWPDPPDPDYSLVRSLLSPKGKVAKDQARRGVLCFVTSASPNVIDQYFKNLDSFLKRVSTEDDDRSVGKSKSASRVAIEDYPAAVNAELYTVLKSHSLCTCLTGRTCDRLRHHARLRLREDDLKVDDQITFDMLFSESPVTWDHWQDLQFCVSIKKKAAKAVKFDTEKVPEVMGGYPDSPEQKMKVVKPTEFCGLVNTRLGSQVRCHVQDSVLRRFHDGFPLVQIFDSGPSVSLQNILRRGRLSNRMKLVLAYIVARSYWQYYDSPWMNSPWTSNSIHFLCEPQVTDGSLPNGVFYASKPYFVVEFEEHDGKIVEYCGTAGVIFRYPQLISLCMILLEIGRGQDLRIDDDGSFEKTLNSNWSLAMRLAHTDRGWGDFDYPHYRKAIIKCLSYKPAEQYSMSPEKAVHARKVAIHDEILQPLGRLLRDLGFAENLHLMDPIDTLHSLSRAPGISTAPVDPTPITTRVSEADLATAWIEDLQDVNDFFQRRTRGVQVKPPRVVILDTGYDSEAVFFNLPGRKRKIKGWRDWVDRSQIPVDNSGHGTHTTATLMKIAPSAAIYVGRIAKDRGSLNGAAHAIAEAIEWAANEVRADIVSMSFGFPSEVPTITDAIVKALYDRRGSIVFFAAASNSGGNRREMFPASLDYVVSIRETNSRGAFTDTNPPVDPSGPVVFGTLGREVPSAWLSGVTGEVTKSGSSVATAVAAGIAAMLMTIINIGRADPRFSMPAHLDRMWTKRGMHDVLTRMSHNMGNRSYYISPMDFFDRKGAEEVWSAISDACAR